MNAKNETKSKWLIVAFLAVIVVSIVAFHTGRIDLNNIKAADIIELKKADLDEVGRYQFFVKDNNVFAYVYILDTKTSRIFLRSIFSEDSEARQILFFPVGDKFWDFGTVNQPLSFMGQAIKRKD